MAGWYQKAHLMLAEGDLPLHTLTLKAILLKSTYVFDNMQESIEIAASADDIASHEADATGYVGGFNGAGRLELDHTVTRDDGPGLIKVDALDLSWAVIGGAVNNTSNAVAIVTEITSDLLSLPIWYINYTAKTTDGGSFQVIWGLNGIVRF